MRQSTHASQGQTASQIAKDISALLDRLHAVVVGPGLGRDSLMQDTAAIIISEVRKRQMPLVVDADGLFLVQNRPEVVQGYASAVLTPNVMEFKRLCDKMGVDPEKVEGGRDKVCAELARRLGGVTIVQKGRQDVISNGKDTMIVNIEGGLKRCGGQGDVLTGCLGTLLAWKKLYSEGVWKYLLHLPLLWDLSDIRHDNSLKDEEMTALAAFGACCTARYCSRQAFAKHKRAMQASDMVHEVGNAYQVLFERYAYDSIGPNESESPKL